MRGRGQERRAEPVDVAPTGSIALMQGEETVVLLRFCGVRLILFLLHSNIGIASRVKRHDLEYKTLSCSQCEASP